MNFAVFNHCFINQDFVIILLYLSIICNVNDGSTIDNDCLKWSLVTLSACRLSVRARRAA